jgi:hypothetical protein
MLIPREMMLVGKKQSYYPDQEIGKNAIIFNSDTNHELASHYTLYAIPDSDYIGYSDELAICILGDKHIKL